MVRRLTPRHFKTGIEALASADGELAAVVARHGPPRMRTRAPGFATLVLLILEQQVSLASAEATYRRLESRTAKHRKKPVANYWICAKLHAT